MDTDNGRGGAAIAIGKKPKEPLALLTQASETM